MMSRVPAAAVLAVALVLVVGFLVAGWLTTPRVRSHTPTAGTRAAAPRIVVLLEHAGTLERGDVTMRIDDDDVSTRLQIQGEQLVVKAPLLNEGRHRVHVRTGPVGVLRRRLDEQWEFVVDTTAPRMRVLSPRGSDATSDVRNARFVLRGEARARVTLTSRGGAVTAQASERGTVRVLVPLAEGWQQVRVVTRDSVGNSSHRSVRVFVDSLAPVVGFRLPATLRTATFQASASAADATEITVQATVDGAAAGVTARRASRRTFLVARPKRLSEGAHVVAFSATDKLGNTTIVGRRVLVDSSERLGDNALSRGARGADVRQLHIQLKRLELWKQSSRSTREWKQRGYGAATAVAVCDFQRRKGLEPDCIAGENTLAAMTLKIVIDRAAHTLTLFRVGRVERVYNVAVGQAAYPTPAGSFEIVNMQLDPTWTPPPDSDWAKGAKPIPAGPNNPLGTRWMGLDAPNVGIHGTNNAASIGYSVSHGCIRMAIPDAEDLFQRVRVGTPVVIV